MVQNLDLTVVILEALEPSYFKKDQAKASSEYQSLGLTLLYRWTRAQMSTNLKESKWD